MDRIRLKKYIKSFATNVGIATAVFILSVFYIPFVISGEGLVWLAIADLFLLGFNTFDAILGWKRIKEILEESE